MDRYAVLIDGGFARRCLRSKTPADASRFDRLTQAIAAHPALSGMRLHRIYYYDATPLEETRAKPLNGGVVNFGQNAVASRSKTLFDELKRLPFFSLRMGETTFNGWQLDSKKLSATQGSSMSVTEAELQPKITQKGVDMRIGMDIASLTLKHHVRVIVLVTGDSDFVPAMKFARREGAQLFLCSFGRHVKPAMHEHSDLLLDISVVVQ
jgi:uncharacterized LabA/DUF88 family protein